MDYGKSFVNICLFRDARMTTWFGCVVIQIGLICYLSHKMIFLAVFLLFMLFHAMILKVNKLFNVSKNS